MKKTATVEEYLKSLPTQSRERLKKIRAIVNQSIPQAEEVISYQMPAFKYHGILLWYAAFKNHYSIFNPAAVKKFASELKDYETTKSAIRIPLEKPVPVNLLKKIIRFSVKNNLEKQKLKEKVK